eukprot:gnl/Chilomastix_cuspidata/380.p1 GENE.gnl/Chilomastix_cuspidata/380~~gnl/Chilomastix_cuspidata/380.p1  ORF type:complete len:541 (+),score=197.06 gnl/Chilomastix_cuspidata/380:32-1624(+)
MGSSASCFSKQDKAPTASVQSNEGSGQIKQIPTVRTEEDRERTLVTEEIVVKEFTHTFKLPKISKDTPLDKLPQFLFSSRAHNEIMFSLTSFEIEAELSSRPFSYQIMALGEPFPLKEPTTPVIEPRLVDAKEGASYTDEFAFTVPAEGSAVLVILPTSGNEDVEVPLEVSLTSNDFFNVLYPELFERLVVDDASDVPDERRHKDVSELPVAEKINATPFDTRAPLVLAGREDVPDAPVRDAQLITEQLMIHSFAERISVPYFPRVAEDVLDELWEAAVQFHVTGPTGTVLRMKVTTKATSQTCVFCVEAPSFPVTAGIPYTAFQNFTDVAGGINLTIPESRALTLVPYTSGTPGEHNNVHLVISAVAPNALVNILYPEPLPLVEAEETSEDAAPNPDLALTGQSAPIAKPISQLATEHLFLTRFDHEIAVAPQPLLITGPVGKTLSVQLEAHDEDAEVSFVHIPMLKEFPAELDGPFENGDEHIGTGKLDEVISFSDTVGSFVIVVRTAPATLLLETKTASFFNLMHYE